MRLSNYTLTPTRINNAKAKARLYKLSDGGGLFVEVSTTGQKTWRYQYRFAGSRRDVKIGRYPEIGVADARARHFELRSLLERGVDPAEVRRQETAERRQQAKDSQPAADQFEAFSRRWIRERLMTRSETYRNQIESRLERFVWPAIGEKPLGGVRPPASRCCWQVPTGAARRNCTTRFSACLTRPWRFWSQSWPVCRSA